MAEWIWEDGIGERRAALIADGRILKARIELPGPALRVGDIVDARIVEATPAGVICAAPAGEALLPSLPRQMTQGQTVRVAITREAIPEPGRQKRAKAKLAAPGTDLASGPDLLARIVASGVPVRRVLPHEPDELEAAGWSEVLDEAENGEIAFGPGALRMTPTPAMVLFDVDGAPPHGALAVAAATAVAAAIARHGIGGSIGIDFPTVDDRAQRLAIDRAIDAALPAPFERTATNGFGFLQIVRPRPRASLPELLRDDRVGAATRAALRAIERTPAGGSRRHVLPRPVLRRLEASPDWRLELARRTGVDPILEEHA